MAVFFDGRCACGREVCDFTCITYAAYMSKQKNIGTWQERMKKEPITNADKIRAMSDEQLAQFLYALYESLGCSMDCPAYDTCDAQGSCVDFLAKWLKQEAK